MSSIANITVYDGAATPVAHVLVAKSVTNQKGVITAFYREQLTGLPDYAQVSLWLTYETLPTGVVKVTRKVTVPVMETILNQNASGYTAPPKVAYTNTYTSIGTFSPRSTVTDRRIGRQIGVNLDNAIATSVAAATSGAVPELVDNLVSPT
jgi:hypothetical protein